MTVVSIDRSAEARGQDQGSSAAKALTVLEVVINAEGGVVGVSDVTLASGLPRSTAHRLLCVLVERGFVDRIGSKYRIGRRFFELSEYSRLSSHGDIREIAADPLEFLFDETGATVLLGVLDDDDLLCVEKITGPGGCRYPARPGGRAPATTSALGKAMLAFSAAPVVEQHLRTPLPRTTPYTVTARRVLVDQLIEARRTGVAYEHEEFRLGFAAVAAPVVIRGQVRAAVAVALPVTGSGTVARHAGAVAEAARRIGADLESYEAAWQPGLRTRPAALLS